MKHNKAFKYLMKFYKSQVILIEKIFEWIMYICNKIYSNMIKDYRKIEDKTNDMKVLLMAIDRMSDFDGNIKNTFSQEETEKMLNNNVNDY